MVLYFDPEVRNGFSLRLSRYPERNATWVWCHLLVDGRLYAFTERRVPCSTARTEPDQPVAIYPALGMAVSLTRLGSSAQMQALSFTAQVRAHAGQSGVDGPGGAPVSLEGVFHPGPLKAGSPAGRFERTGRVEATVRAGDKTVHLSGMAKAHEQTQTAPRFFAPFTYAMLWGPNASMIGMMSKTRRYGDFETAGADVDMDSFRIEPWSAHRRFAATLKGGRGIAGEAETLYRYEVPIFGKRWYGRIVRASAEGQPMVGMINDWKPDEQPYGLT
jgi:hypothetical protein